MESPALFRVFPTRKCIPKAGYAISTSGIPVALEWQKRFSHSNAHGPLFFSAGLEAEIRHGAKSKAKVNGHKKNLDSGLNVHPVGINLLAQAGYGDIGVYLRYSTYSLFEHKKGPELYPYSFGLCWYW